MDGLTGFVDEKYRRIYLEIKDFYTSMRSPGFRGDSGTGFPACVGGEYTGQPQAFKIRPVTGLLRRGVNPATKTTRKDKGLIIIASPAFQGRSNLYHFCNIRLLRPKNGPRKDGTRRPR
jgi:hypothetical protein